MRLNLGLGFNRRRRVGGGAPAFTPADVFTAGIDGVWSDRITPADLWQDVARTTPVTAPGQPVRSHRVRTSSGVTFMTDTSGTIIYRVNGAGAGYLEIPASGGFLQSAGTFATPVGNQESTMMAAVDYDGTYSDGQGFIGYHPNFVAAGTHRALRMVGSGALAVETGNPGNGIAGPGIVPLTFAVHEGRFAANISVAINGGTFTTLTPASPTNTPANQSLVVGRALVATQAPGKYYGYLHVVKVLTAGERASLVAWLTALENP